MCACVWVCVCAGVCAWMGAFVFEMCEGVCLRYVCRGKDDYGEDISQPAREREMPTYVCACVCVCGCV